MENLKSYDKIKNDFDREAQRENGMFSKNLTECDQLSIKALDSVIKPYWKVLEIGCGMGNVIEGLKEPLIERHCIDLSDKMLERCSIQKKKVGNMDELPYEDNTFDLVYMIMTLQQSKDRNKTLAEMERVAKGIMVVIDGNKNSAIGQLREKQMKDGTWQTCGEAQWLDEKDFPGWDVKSLNNHILILTKIKQ